MLMSDDWMMSHMLWVNLIFGFNNSMTMFNWLGVMNWSNMIGCGFMVHWLVMNCGVMHW